MEGKLLPFDGDTRESSATFAKSLEPMREGRDNSLAKSVHWPECNVGSSCLCFDAVRGSSDRDRICMGNSNARAVGPSTCAAGGSISGWGAGLKEGLTSPSATKCSTAEDMNAARLCAAIWSDWD
mmetsp:Transcript_14925/g.23729  ORF Transcript_14925/g.23729 Transcript_14925/m.23729 type:complete len:125 (+) Transcript_14925:566-940(+)